MIIAGHILALRLPFANGVVCKFKRPFLVINRENNILELLNVSSIKGKERKLLFSSNIEITSYHPPLDHPSFLKLDELYTIDYFDELKSSIYKGKGPLIEDEFNKLISEYYIYEKKYEVRKIRQFETQVRQDNRL